MSDYEAGTASPLHSKKFGMQTGLLQKGRSPLGRETRRTELAPGLATWQLALLLFVAFAAGRLTTTQSWHRKVASSSSSANLVDGSAQYPKSEAAITRELGTTVQKIDEGDPLLQATWPFHKYLYWGPYVDYPGVHSGYIHQTISLTCALEEAKHLGRTLVAPSYIRFPPHHNPPGLAKAWFGHEWRDSWGTPLEEFFDLNSTDSLNGVRVITDSSPEWAFALSRSLTSVGFNVSIDELAQEPYVSQVIIDRNVGHGKYWFNQCLPRLGGLPNYDFIWWNATNWSGGMKYAKSLVDATEKMHKQLGPDFVAMHVRRGDKVVFGGTNRTLWPHVDRDTRADAILQKLTSHFPEGTVVYLATNELAPGFFEPLSVRYRVFTPADFRALLSPLLHNNFQMFILESMLFRRAKAYVGTFRNEIPSWGDHLHLTRDPRNGCKTLHELVLTFSGEEEESCPEDPTT